MTSPARVLFVCTANECRSPFAEAIARRRSGRRAIAFESAGVDARRRPMPDVGLTLARELGLDLDNHVSRTVPWDNLGDYDVLLPLTRAHARELLAADPAVRSRVFTVKQFARWISAHPRPRRAAIGPWLDVVAADRPLAEFIGEASADDVADPVRRPLGDWRRMGVELDVAIRAIIDGLYVSRPSHIR